MATVAVLTLAVSVLFVSPSEPSVALPARAAVKGIVDAAARSTVKVVAQGCGITSRGSGFVVGHDLVMTSAHVVGPLPEIRIEDQGGPHPASRVLVDESKDLAILRAGGLAGAPLPLGTRPVDRGAQGVVLGFPRGGLFTTGPAAVLDPSPPFTVKAPLDHEFQRSVLQLQAHVDHGNSGGPFIGLNGEVLGVVFSQAKVLKDVAYALKAEELLPQVRAAEGRPSAPPPPGAC
jgi:S1-C subfamily serine protease